MILGFFTCAEADGEPVNPKTIDNAAVKAILLAVIDFLLPFWRGFALFDLFGLRRDGQLAIDLLVMELSLITVTCELLGRATIG
jgi:hypothetical protein